MRLARNIIQLQALRKVTGMAKLQYSSFIDGLIRELQMESVAEGSLESRSDLSWLDTYDAAELDYSWRAEHYYDYADIDPDEYETEKEYLRAVEERYGWEDYCDQDDGGRKYAIDDDY